MNKKEVQKLVHGLYRLHWKSGGNSLAAVGSLSNGKRWFAPTNWCAPEGMAASIVGFDRRWQLVQEAELLKASTY